MKGTVSKGMNVLCPDSNRLQSTQGWRDPPPQPHNVKKIREKGK